MSFAGEVREELCSRTGSARHCQIAELTAIITMCGGVSFSENDRVMLRIHTENLFVARKFTLLIRQLFSLNPECGVRAGRKSSLCSCVISGHEDAVRVLRATKLMNSRHEIIENDLSSDNLVTQRSCCRKAFLRGAFLVAGSVSDPTKFYHFEIACSSPEKAGLIQTMICSIGGQASIAARRGHQIVYMKSGEQISDMLAAMGAPRAVLRFENARVLRDVKGHVNREVNCETANIRRTVTSALRQVSDIRYLHSRVGIDNLPGSLQQAARLRLEYPDMPLKELGEKNDPPIGKSGMNHRLRRLSALADQMREEDHNKGDFYSV